MLNPWTEYCSELYKHKANGNLLELKYPQTDTADDHPDFTEKWRLQYNHSRKESQLESATSKQKWSKQKQRM